MLRDLLLILVSATPFRDFAVLEALSGLLSWTCFRMGFGEDFEAMRFVSFPRPVTETVTSSPGLR